MSRNEKGFGVIEVALVLVILGIIGFTGWRVYEANREVSQTPIDNSTVVPSDNDETSWQRIESGDKSFSVQIPDGWGEIQRPKSEDLLSIMGQQQPKYQAGKPVTIKDVEGWGTDAPVVFTILIHDNIAEPRGSAAEFTAGELKGKKYNYVALEDTERGLGQEDKGDKYYDYRFDLGDGKQLVIWYNVYVKTDPTDQIKTIDRIVESIQVKK